MFKLDQYIMVQQKNKLLRAFRVAIVATLQETTLFAIRPVFNYGFDPRPGFLQPIEHAICRIPRAVVPRVEPFRNVSRPAPLKRHSGNRVNMCNAIQNIGRTTQVKVWATPCPRVRRATSSVRATPAPLYHCAACA